MNWYGMYYMYNMYYVFFKTAIRLPEKRKKYFSSILSTVVAQTALPYMLMGIFIFCVIGIYFPSMAAANWIFFRQINSVWVKLKL